MSRRVVVAPPGGADLRVFSPRGIATPRRDVIIVAIILKTTSYNTIKKVQRFNDTLNPLYFDLHRSNFTLMSLLYSTYMLTLFPPSYTWPPAYKPAQ